MYNFFKLCCGTSPGQDPLDPPLESKPQIHKSTCHNHVSGNPRETPSGDRT